MNLKKLSLASLFLVLSCSFGWAQDAAEGEEPVTDPNVNATFVKMTSVTQLVPGNRFLFVVPSNKYGTGFVAMACPDGDHRNGVGVSGSESAIDKDMQLIFCDAVNVDTNTPVAFVLGDGGKDNNGNDTFTFYDEVEEGYVSAPSNNGNNFPISTTLNDRARWTVVYTNGVFEVRNVADPNKYIEHRDNGTPEFVASSKNNQHAYLFVQYSAEERITLARSNGGDDLNYYATAYVAKDMKLDEKMAAFDVTPLPTTTETQELALTEVVPAGEILGAYTPVILRFENEDVDAAPYKDLPIYTLVTTERTQETHLQGTLEDIDAPANSFKLRKQAVEDETGEEVGTVAFFKADGTSILANKAYYVLGEAAEEGEETGEVKVLTFSFSGATGIEKVNTPQEVNNGAIYNLAGQQVNKNYRGIVLKNGKKFLNK